MGIKEDCTGREYIASQRKSHHDWNLDLQEGQTLTSGFRLSDYLPSYLQATYAYLAAHPLAYAAIGTCAGLGVAIPPVGIAMIFVGLAVAMALYCYGLNKLLQHEIKVAADNPDNHAKNTLASAFSARFFGTSKVPAPAAASSDQQEATSTTWSFFSSIKNMIFGKSSSNQNKKK